MDGEMIAFIKMLLIFMASLLYSYFIASKVPKGKLRFISLLPVFSLFVSFPLYLSSALLTIHVAFVVTWLTTFKLLLFSFDSGPLASDPPLSFPLFASIAFFPTIIKPKETTSCSQNLRKDSNVAQESPPKLCINMPAKVVIFAILFLSGNSHNELLCRPIAKLYINCVTLYFYLDMVMCLSNAFIRSTFSIEVKRPFDEPYLSTSLQNFWGRRWNLVVSDILHNMIYKPIRYKVRTPRWVAVIVVFVVSGLMHELLYYYIVRTTPTWEVTWFFIINGMCVAVEIELKRTLGKRWQLHWLVSVPLTILFLEVTLHWLFFPPLLRIIGKICKTNSGTLL